MRVQRQAGGTLPERPKQWPDDGVAREVGCSVEICALHKKVSSMVRVEDDQPRRGTRWDAQGELHGFATVYYMLGTW